MAKKLTDDQKRELIVDTLGELGQMSPQDLMSRTGTKGADIKHIVKELKDDGTMVISGNSCRLSDEAQAEYDNAKVPAVPVKVKAKPKAAPVAAVATAPAKPSKPTKVVPVVEEDIPELEYELEDDGTGEPEEDVDEMINEYNALQAKSRKNKTEQARYQTLEERLDELGVFDPEEDADGSSSVDEMEDGTGTEGLGEGDLEGFDDETESGGEGEDSPEGDEDPDAFEDDHDDDFSDDHDTDEDEDPVEEEAVPARPTKAQAKGTPKPSAGKPSPKTAKVAGAGSRVTDPQAAFSMSFKPIDTLTDDELETRIESATEAAEMLSGQGHEDVAEMLMRSVAKARKQLNKRS